MAATNNLIFRGWSVTPLDDQNKQNNIENVISYIIDLVLNRENLSEFSTLRISNEGKAEETKFGNLPNVEVGGNKVELFKDVNLIGQGAHGKVYSTYDTERNQTVVIKRIS